MPEERTPAANDAAAPAASEKDAVLQKLIQDAARLPDNVDLYEWIDDWLSSERVQLAREWKQVTSKSGGSTFYRNTRTKKTTWSRPAGAPGSDWVARTATDGRTFWFNTRTKDKTWLDPHVLWVKYVSKSQGRPYWVNRRTRETTWTDPQVTALPGTPDVAECKVMEG
ncbi:putative NEDD4-like E3 ubiquitin-protein ligase WWP1 [Diplonema papillatum]|nr:putative NEDD4-like E3 ubiquitin-protein ligase WWP1 [Diplonema papillatum]